MESLPASPVGLKPRVPAGQALSLAQFTALPPVTPRALPTEGPQKTTFTNP